MVERMIEIQVSLLTPGWPSVYLRNMKCQDSSNKTTMYIFYEGWNFNFGNTPLDWIQELLE